MQHKITEAKETKSKRSSFIPDQVLYLSLSVLNFIEK